MNFRVETRIVSDVLYGLQVDPRAVIRLQMREPLKVIRVVLKKVEETMVEELRGLEMLGDPKPVGQEVNGFVESFGGKGLYWDCYYGLSVEEKLFTGG